MTGDTQHLPGYSLLLADDPSVNHLSDLDWTRRKEFLFDPSLLGEAVERACRGAGLRRINYEVLRQLVNHPGRTRPCPLRVRAAGKITGPVCPVPKEARKDPECAYSDARHGQLRARIAAELQRLIEQAY